MSINWTMVLEAANLVKEEYDNVEKNIFDGIALFGAGQFGQLSLEYLTGGGGNVKCFLDSSPDKQGKRITGLEILPASDFTKGVILITARRAINEIKEIIGNRLPTMSFEAWFTIKNIKKYEYVRNNILSDEKSKMVLDTLLYETLTQKNQHFAEIYEPNQYFCLQNFVKFSDECFVDVGAYVGDSIEKFIWSRSGVFDHIYAFEPIEKQFKAMGNRVKRLVGEWGIDENKITLLQTGISDKHQNVKINIDDMRPRSSIFFNDGIESEYAHNILCMSLDEYFYDKRVSFIKADIEGFEMKLLRGAMRTIKNNKPKMALCVYHKLTDLFEMTELIRSIDENYNFSLRHHSYETSETVLYCEV